jgi:hypothetical protein
MFWFKENKATGKRGEDLPLPNEGLPDSYRPSGLCPRCGKQSSFDNVGSLPVTFDSGYILHHSGEKEPTLIDRVSALICRHCNQGVIVVEEQWIGDSPKKEGNKGGIISWRGIHWWPLPETNLSSDIPNEIANAFSEANTALSTNCPRASAVMARRTLEAITVEKGETIGNLANRLDALNKKGILLPTLSEWAKEVRLVGNQGAHFDPIQPVTTDDAKQLLVFVRELLKHLYEIPAELKRKRSK